MVELTAIGSNPGYTIDRYRWDFPDLTTQNTKDARKNFTTTGDQAVRYRIFTVNGCTGDTTKTVKVVESPMASATLTGKPCVDSLQTFLSSSTASGQTWYWRFGDGRFDSSKTSASITHAYRSAGSGLRFRHWVKTSQGCASDSVEYPIAGIFANPPSLDFSVASDSICPGSLFRFTAGASSGVVGWQWDFGNGESAVSAPGVQTSYKASGDYTASLRVTDVRGCGSAPMSKPVRVAPTPVADAGIDRSVLKGQSVRLSGTATGAGPFDYSWNPPQYLDNPSVSNPVSTPLTDIGYALTVTDRQSGCSGSDSVKVSILEKFTVPNTFTPNGDGINDRWEIASLGQYPGCVVEIYNGWGQRIYRSVGYATPWDGTVKGRKVQAGTYYYIIDPGSGEPRKVGYLSVLW
jgi:gliding motility-associated-like protein